MRERCEKRSAFSIQTDWRVAERRRLADGWNGPSPRRARAAFTAATIETTGAGTRLGTDGPPTAGTSGSETFGTAAGVVAGTASADAHTIDAHASARDPQGMEPPCSGPPPSAAPPNQSRRVLPIQPDGKPR